MFLFNLLHPQGQSPRSLHRIFAQSVFTLTCFFCLFAALLFTGCQPEAKVDTGNLNGTWLFNSYPSYMIDTSAKTIEYTDTYKGKIANSPNFTEKSGLIIIEFTNYKRYVYEQDPPYALLDTIVDPPDVIGSYGALYWTGLTSNSVKMADHWVFDVDTFEYIHVMYTTLQEAQEKFTMEIGATISWGNIDPYNK